jgi:uncharacterized membrane protein HdeD (DUF308 family)
MTTIDSFLQPLHQGVWEVVVPAYDVTTPLDDEWVCSRINVPTPGVIASYRKGRYHLHITRDAWRVHLDRYDPAVHPVLHLIDDAPLLLMISETLITLISLTRGSPDHGINNLLSWQIGTYRVHMVSGVLLSVLGIGLIMIPDLSFAGITSVLIPTVVFGAGMFTLAGWAPSDREGERESVIRGMTTISLAGLLAVIPPFFWGALILTVLAVWMFASAGMLLRRVVHGRQAVPEGLVSRAAIGLCSLVLGVLSVTAPVETIMLFTSLLGVVTLVLGLVVLGVGYQLRGMMQHQD